MKKLQCFCTGVFSLWRKGNRTDQMQQSGGLLPARARPSGSLISAKRKCKSIPVRVTMKKSLTTRGGIFSYMDCVGIERVAPVRTLVQKRAGGTFLARGRFHGAWSAAGKAVKQAPLCRLLQRICSMRPSVSLYAAFLTYDIFHPRQTCACRGCCYGL